eukprot:g27852.t1
MQVAVSNLTRVEPDLASKGPRLQGSVCDQLIASLPCNQSLVLNESFDMNARCPGHCPYHAMDQRHGMSFCTASCVAASQCARYNPDAPVADQEAGTCRGALVDGCYRPKLDGTDSCLQCAAWYEQTPSGQCQVQYLWVAYLVAAISGCALLLILGYLVHLHCRPITNLQGLNEGLGARSQQKYRDPTDRQLWPWMTNLCRTEVGGPGLMLHFNFLAAVVVWALAVGLGWVVLAYLVDTELLELGRRPYGTAYRNDERRMELMWAKLLYLAMVYLATFLGSLAHGLRQRRLFRQSNVQDTMKAFSALVKGLPSIPASEVHVESDLAHVVSSLTAWSSFCTCLPHRSSAQSLPLHGVMYYVCKGCSDCVDGSCQACSKCCQGCDATCEKLCTGLGAICASLCLPCAVIWSRPLGMYVVLCCGFNIPTAIISVYFFVEADDCMARNLPAFFLTNVVLSCLHMGFALYFQTRLVRGLEKAEQELQNPPAKETGGAAGGAVVATGTGGSDGPVCQMWCRPLAKLDLNFHVPLTTAHGCT